MKNGLKSFALQFATFGILAYGSFALVACSKKAPPPVVAPAPAASEPEGPVASTDDMITSILRVSDRIITVCYNGTDDGQNVFLLKYKPAEDDDYGQGWVYVKGQKFYTTAAGKWFTEAPVRDAFVRVYPDTTGLTCKSQ